MNLCWSESRKGVGTLAIIAIFLAVVGLVQLFQHLFSDQVVNLTTNAVVGRATLEVANSAVNEARGLICDRVNSVGSPVFAAIRRTGMARFAATDLSVSEADLVVTQRLIASDYAAVQKVVSLRSQFDLRQFLDVEEQEYDGVIRAEVQAQSLLERTIQRTAWKSWLFRLIHLAPAGELRSTVGFIRAADQVLRARWDAAGITRTFIESDLPILIREMTKVVTDLRNKQTSDSQEQQAIQNLLAIYSPLIEGADGGRLGRVLTPLTAPYRALVPLPTVSTDVMLEHRSTAFAIGDFDLQGDLDVLIRNQVAARDKAVRLGEQVKQANDQGALQINQQYTVAVGELAESIGEVVKRYLRFRDTFTLVPPSDPRTAGIRTAFGRLDPVTRHPRLASAPIFDPRVTLLISANELQSTPDEALQKILGREGQDGGFQGVVLVENQGRPMTLSGRMKGRWTMVFMGSVTISDLARTDAARDLFTVVHAGGPDTTFRLAGNIDATIIGTGTRLSVARGTHINGGLYLQDVATDAVIEPALGDSEMVSPDPLRAALPAEQLRHVVVSPWTRSVGASRGR